MRCFLAVILFVLAASLPARADLRAAEFDARLLTVGEKRFLQAALAFDGKYRGLLDGAWGAGSQQALEDWAGRRFVTFGDVAPLVAGFDGERRRNGWARLGSDDSVTFLAPVLRLDLDESDRDSVTLRSPDDSLLVRVLFDAAARTNAMHDWLASNHAGPERLYWTDRDGRRVTAGRLDTGRSVYLRSERFGRLFATVVVQFEPRMTGAAQVVIASIARGPQDDLALPARGALAGLAAGASPPAGGRITLPPAAATGKQAAVPAPTAEPARGSGTGFYVNNTDIVTAAHVIDGCRVLSLTDGTTLTVVASDIRLDLAVVTSGRRSDAWLGIDGGTAPRLGESVFAVGYPLRGLYGSGLTVTGGNLSTLPDPADGRGRMMISAPVQPGNSGGPVLNRAGVVVGVVVSRADDIFVLRQSGALPQNMNFAVGLDTLRGFLVRARVVMPSVASETGRPEDGLTDGVQAAVVPVLCH
jgi:S1-C subfamily serine protease